MSYASGPLLAIFDHDGVLVDSFDRHRRHGSELGKRTGLAITPGFIHETFGMTNPMILRKLLGEALVETEARDTPTSRNFCYRELGSGARST